MAFSKMAGLEVTPPRPSASTSRLSSPLTMRLLRMKSSQGDCLYCARPERELVSAVERKVRLVMLISSPVSTVNGTRQSPTGYGSLDRNDPSKRREEVLGGDGVVAECFLHVS